MVKFDIRKLNIWFGAIHALKEVSLQVQANEILSVIGPANSGKTTFLRMLNRINDLQPNLKLTGSVSLDGKDIMMTDAEEVRSQVGMVFALPLPLPLSIVDNVAYGVRMRGARKQALAGVIEQALRDAYLWE